MQLNEQIWALHHQGLSLCDIGRQLGLSHMTVKYRLDELVRGKKRQSAPWKIRKSYGTPESRRCSNALKSRRRYAKRPEYYLRKSAQWRAKKRISDIPAPRHGFPWTAAEDALVVQDLPGGLIQSAYRLGRSYASVAKRRHYLSHFRRGTTGRTAATT